MRVIIAFLITTLALIACHQTSQQLNLSKGETALHFIHDYLDFRENYNSNEESIAWINARNDLSESFKNEYERALKEAFEYDPELGNDFDIILNAQDYPEKFIIDSISDEFVFLGSDENSNYYLALKVISVDNQWRVDGSGIINIPNEFQEK